MKLLALLVCISSVAAVETVPKYMGEISPTQGMWHQKISQQDKLIYKLVSLSKSTSYEVKLSYAATSPSVFTLRLRNEQLDPSSFSHHQLRRKLLNTEKIILPPTHKQMFVEVTMQPEGVSAFENVQQRTTVFNIELEELVLGQIPMCALRLIGFCVIMLLGAAKFLYPWLKRIISLQDELDSLAPFEKKA